MAINSNQSGHVEVENLNFRLGNQFALLEGDAHENLTVEGTAPPPSEKPKTKASSSSNPLRVNDGNGKKRFSTKPQGSFYHGKGRVHDLERQNGNGRSNGVRPNNNQLGGRRGHDFERQNGNGRSNDVRPNNNQLGGRGGHDIERQNGNGRINSVRSNNNQLGGRRGHDLERQNGNGRINGVRPNNQLGRSNFKQNNGYNASKKSEKEEKEEEKEVPNGESEGEGWQVIRRRNTGKQENGSRRNYGPPSNSKSNYGPSSRTRFANRRRIYFGDIPSNIVVEGWTKEKRDGDVARRDQVTHKANEKHQQLVTQFESMHIDEKNKHVTMDKNDNKEWKSSGTQRVKQMNQTVRRDRDKFRNAVAKPPSCEDLFEFPPLLQS